MEGIKEMKKTLQECKEIVAEQNAFNLNPDYRGFELKLMQIIDLANKMYYEQSEWIEINPNDVNTIPDENVWTYWFQLDKVVFVPKGEFVPLGVVSHYMLLTKPSPPKQ